MTPKQDKRADQKVHPLVNEDRELVRQAVQEVLEAEMDEALGARKGVAMHGISGGFLKLSRTDFLTLGPERGGQEGWPG